ncbi:MAG: hypothetical protein ACI9EF_003968, partial [Pseudohongiellaceae bacterium]
AEEHTFKSTYRVAPGADPSDILWAHHGADGVHIDSDGRLIVDTAAGPLVDAAPVAWQVIDEAHREVPVSFRLSEGTDGAVDVGYTLGDYDRSQPLWIDPAVVVQTGFLGGTAQDEAQAVAVDAAGNVYVGGWARSDENSFPATVGPHVTYTPTFSPWGDAFVAKLDPTGSTLIYAGYIGGWEFDFVNDMAVDSLGRVIVGGHTQSTENDGFPVIGGPDMTHNGGIDGWVARVSADGTSLEYCGFVGGSANEDRLFGVDVDSSGRAYLAGRASSTQLTFPTAVGPDSFHNGSSDGFVARLDSNGFAYEYCGFIGGLSSDEATAIHCDDFGNAWVTGHTSSDATSFPTSVGPSLVNAGGSDAFVARIAPDGSSLLWCGYVGGSGYETPAGMDVDANGDVYIAGVTTSLDFPVVVGPGLTPTGTADGFVAKIKGDGTAALYAGVIAGSSTDSLSDIAVDDEGGAWVVGYTFTKETDPTPLPLGGGPDMTYNGTGDGLVARVLPSGAGLDFCGYVGGDLHDRLWAVSLVPSALTPGVTEAWATGHTLSTEATLPAVGGFDSTQNGQEDALVVHLQSAHDPWVDLGNALAGGLGDPTCVGAGTLGPNTPISLTLGNARANSTAYLCAGPGTLFVPFKGGVLVPDINPPGFYVPVPTGAQGAIVLSGTMPPGFPSGLTLYYQWWILDAAGPAGFSASNAVSETTP